MTRPAITQVRPPAVTSLPVLAAHRADLLMPAELDRLRREREKQSTAWARERERHAKLTPAQVRAEVQRRNAESSRKRTVAEAPARPAATAHPAPTAARTTAVLASPAPVLDVEDDLFASRNSPSTAAVVVDLPAAAGSLDEYMQGRNRVAVRGAK